MRSGVPALSGAAHARVSPSAAAGMARSVVTVTEADRSVLTWLSRTCAPLPALSMTLTNDSFLACRTMITSSRPSLTSASGAAFFPAAR
jgi:hypothetical protein